MYMLLDSKKIQGFQFVTPKNVDGAFTTWSKVPSSMTMYKDHYR